jgi:hypothetical protein
MVSGPSSTGSDWSKMSSISDVSLLLERVAAMGTDVSVCAQILAAPGAGEGKLCTTTRAGIFFQIERGAAVGAEIDTTGRTLVVVLTDRLAAIAAETGSFDLRFLSVRLCFLVLILKPFIQLHAAVRADRGVFRNLLIAVGAKDAIFVVFSLPFILKAFFHLCATVRADRGIGRDLLVTLRTVETELGSALGADRIVGVHLGPALETDGLHLLKLVLI